MSTYIYHCVKSYTNFEMLFIQIYKHIYHKDSFASTNKNNKIINCVLYFENHLL